MVACTRSLDGVDVQIECGWESVGGLGLPLWAVGMCWWGSDMGRWDNGKGEESGSVFNV